MSLPSNDHPPDSDHDLLAEAEKFLHENPDIQYVDAMFVDINGIFRGKRYPRGDIPSLYQSGMLMPLSALVLDVVGNSSDACGIGFSDGDPDGRVRPVPGTLVRVPWAKESTAQCLVSFDETNGEKAFLEPRNILARVLQGLLDDGFNPVVAMELEFYLTDPKKTPEGYPQPPISPLTGERDMSTQVYGMDEVEAYSGVLGDIETTCHQQLIPSYTASAEYAAGQFEVNLKHVDSAVMAADHSALLCRAVCNVAAKHGFRATFMAKPFLQQAGSGLHMHVSLFDNDGVNLFAAGEEPVQNAILRHAVGGMQEAMIESMALFAPNINSYRRYQPKIYVPMSPSWGVNNRSLAFRVPLGSGNARRIEHRVAGADANPYLALAAVLAACHHGIKNKLDPGDPEIGNASDKFAAGFPRSIEEAMYALKKATVLPSYIGETYMEIYRHTKLAEAVNFREEISKREYDWYL